MMLTFDFFVVKVVFKNESKIDFISKAIFLD